MSRKDVAYLIVLAALVATAFGPLDGWQRAVGIGAMLIAAGVLLAPADAR